MLVGITYGIQPYGGHVMGWTSPFVLACLPGGAAVLAVFLIVERRVRNPLFVLPLFSGSSWPDRCPGCCLTG